MKSGRLILEWDKAILTSSWSIRLKGQFIGKFDSNLEKAEILYFLYQLNHILWQHSHHTEITGIVQEKNLFFGRFLNFQLLSTYADAYGKIWVLLQMLHKRV